MFSLSRGRHYTYMRLTFEIIEAVNQTSQLYSFADNRTYHWIMALSSLLVLNGVCLPGLFLLTRVRPEFRWYTRLVMAGLDSAFDMAYLVIALVFSDQKSFGNSESWFVAVLGIVVPVVSLVSRRSMFSRNWTASGHAARKRQKKTTLRVVIFFSFLVATYCILSGGIFLHMARQGDYECREMLGSALWDGAKPQYVIVGAVEAAICWRLSQCLAL